MTKKVTPKIKEKVEHRKGRRPSALTEAQFADKVKLARVALSRVMRECHAAEKWDEWADGYEAGWGDASRKRE